MSAWLAVLVHTPAHASLGPVLTYRHREVLPAGTLVPLVWDRAAPYAPKRYIGVRYIATGSTIATASVTAAVVKSVQDMKNIYFKSGFAVS